VQGKAASAISKKIFYLGDTSLRAIVVGVVKDFFFKSLHNVIEPAVLAYKDSSDFRWSVLAKAPPAILPKLKVLWNRYFPTDVFSYYYLDESFDSQ